MAQLKNVKFVTAPRRGFAERYSVKVSLGGISVMTGFVERHAICWVPPQSDSLCKFGCSWMGWCAELGEMRERRAVVGFTDDIVAATRRVSRHGLHARIAGPLLLRGRVGLWQIEDALQPIADELAAVTLPPFELAVIHGQVALVPRSPSRELTELIARVEDAIAPVTTDAAAPEEATTPRYNGAGAVSQLPVSSAHRFHLPLTDTIDLGTAFRIRDELAPRLEQVLTRPRRFAELALMGDPGDGRPVPVLKRFALREDVASRTASVLPSFGPETLMP